MSTSRRLWLTGLASLLACSASWSAVCDDPTSLRVALIPKSRAQEQRTTLLPLLQALGQSTQRRVELTLPSSYSAVIEGLLGGTVDVAELGPASYAMLMERAPAVSVFAALSSADGTDPQQPARYHALLLTNADSGLDTLAKLQGKRVGLTDPVSTSGALLPRAGVLRLTGQALESYFGQVSFAGSHDRALASLRKGQVDAAFVSSTRLDEAVRAGALKREDVRELWRSPAVPTNPYVVRKRLCPKLQASVRDAFLKPRPGFEGMYRQLGTGPFVRADDADYQAVRELLGAAATQPAPR
ncbi:MAG: phosphate/phosphite/phosphonate ABC transporter substrate-binding protein [Hydrogenophaga sp.]|nr:phosphate/phosphite/phosphonate ABC transporter substrate-binding protein [Hydrogenophaga sp.]